MKATEVKLLSFLKKSPQFVIPIYQRTYSWTARECRQLWDDILRPGHNDNIAAHFVGSIVYIERGLYQIATQSALLVIDGQQRLTTVMLILEVLARCVGDGEPMDGFSAKKLRNYYLLNPEEAVGELVRQTGMASEREILTGIGAGSRCGGRKYGTAEAGGRIGITENFTFLDDPGAGVSRAGRLCRCARGARRAHVSAGQSPSSRDQDNRGGICRKL